MKRDSLLGHARLAARRPHGERRSPEDRRRAARRIGPDLRLERRARSLCRWPRVRRCGDVRRAHVLRRNRDRRDGVRHLRPRERRAPVRASRARAPRSGIAADLPHLRVARALGSHHGPAVLRAGLYSRQPHPHLRQPLVARVGAAPPAGRAVVSRRFLVPARRHRIRPPRARPAACRRGDDGHDDAAAARRRLLRLSLRGERPVDRLHDRFRAQARRPDGDRELRRHSSATPTS